MNTKFLSLLAGAALVGSVGFANAAEPMELTAVQMDSVTAAGKHNGGGHGNRMQKPKKVKIVNVVKQEANAYADSSIYAKICIKCTTGDATAIASNVNVQ